MRIRTERETQEAIVATMKLAGFVVRHTSAHRQKEGSGVSKGIADLLVKHRVCPLEISLELEVKRPGPIRYTSPEQREAHAQGFIVVAQSEAEALEHGRRFVQKFGLSDPGFLAAIERIDRTLASIRKGPRVVV